MLKMRDYKFCGISDGGLLENKAEMDEDEFSWLKIILLVKTLSAIQLL